MKLSIERATLLSALGTVGAVIAPRLTSPVYQHVKAVAAGGKLVLMGTDLETGIRLDLTELAIEQEGSALFPARLRSILQESPAAEVRIDADGTRVRVETLASEYEMPGEDPAAFADVAEFGADEPAFEVAAGDLARAVGRVAFAAAKDEGKYSMRAVLWDVTDAGVKLVATDGKRLAVATLACEARGALLGTARLVPPKAMTMVAGLLTADPAAAVRVALRENDALFRAPRATVYSRLVEGRYPPYSTVIPKKPLVKVPLVAGPFLAAVRQAAILTDTEAKRIDFAFTPQLVTLTTAGTTAGRSKVTHPLPDYAGPAVTITFDPAYLTEMLRAVGPDTPLLLSMVDGKHAAVFRTAGEEYLYLVVPLT